MVYWTLDYFKVLYTEYTSLGVSVRDFCRERGIKENRFYYWVKMFKSHTVSTLQTPRDFIPISSDSVSRLTQGSIEFKKDNTISPHVEDIKITYPNGVVLQLVGGYDLELLKRLITLNT